MNADLWRLYLLKSALAQVPQVGGVVSLKNAVGATPGGKVLQKSVGNMPGGQVSSEAGKATGITK